MVNIVLHAAMVDWNWDLSQILRNFKRFQHTLSSVMIPVTSGATNPGVLATVLPIDIRNPE